MARVNGFLARIAPISFWWIYSRIKLLRSFQLGVKTLGMMFQELIFLKIFLANILNLMILFVLFVKLD
ncbi:MAG: hypothetical protein EBR82_63700 [Caulobacteraceae bacterium]|nr:hypothetical protein [Caulobacteraceae bacterium]